MFYSIPNGAHIKMPLQIIGIRDISPGSDVDEHVRACRVELRENHNSNWALMYFQSIFKKFNVNNVDALFREHTNEEIILAMQEFPIESESDSFKLIFKEANLPKDTVGIKIQIV